MLGKDCCATCKKTWFGKTCEILASQNPEYAELVNSTRIGSMLDPNSPYNRLHTIKEENICPQYNSIYIEYPLVIDKIERDPIEYGWCLGHDVGTLVKVRPCGEKYEGKTYLGILLGDLPRSIMSSCKNNILTISAMSNPGIFVPELKEIIFGDSSWWAEIESEEDLKDITQEDIENTWYVKMLREMK